MSEARLQGLVNCIRALDSAVVAFSGGVDSTFLVKVAQLSGIRFLAVTGRSITVPPDDIDSVANIVSLLGLEHRFIDSGELTNVNFVSNPPDRCFYCKGTLFARLREIASQEGFRHVIDGSNADDAEDFRPGMRAAQRHAVVSPLHDAGLGKAEIRELSRSLGLPTWNKPSSPCLSSRIPYGWTITAAAIGKVAKAEGVLKAAGFRIVRVRSFGDCAVIEVGRDEIERFRSSELRRQVRERFRIIGFARVFLDEEGYGSGKLNDRRYVEKALRFPPLGDDREESGW